MIGSNNKENFERMGNQNLIKEKKKGKEIHWKKDFIKNKERDF